MVKSLVIWVIWVPWQSKQNGAAVDVSVEMASHSCFYWKNTIALRIQRFAVGANMICLTYATDWWAAIDPVIHGEPGVAYIRGASHIRDKTVGNKNVDNSDVVWSIACRRCSNYIFILNLTPGFNGLSEDNCTRIQETFKFWDLVRLILEVLRYCWQPQLS